MACAGTISVRNSDGLSDINGPLLLPPTVAMSFMTSDDRCYYWSCVTCAVATSPHISDGCSDISGPSLLTPTVVIGYLTLMGYLISAVHRYWTAQ
jgi:hypothetical protein